MLDKLAGFVYEMGGRPSSHELIRTSEEGSGTGGARATGARCGATRFMELEREVEQEYRPQMRVALQQKVEAVAESLRSQTPQCARCGRAMRYHDTRPVSWWARCGKLLALVARYRCSGCGSECRPLLEELGVEPGRISGSLARLLALLAVVAPYPLAARLAWLLLGVPVSAMGVWRVVQRLGEAAARYQEDLSQYHNDTCSQEPRATQAPAVVVLGVDGCNLGMQVRKQRRRRPAEGSPLPPLPPVEDGQFREVKTGVLLRPEERVETSPGRRSLVRRFLVTCLGDADAIFAHLWAQLQELGWLGVQTMVVVIGDGAEWIWNRTWMFPRHCEILDFWHALEHAWEFARLRYGEGSQRAERWIHQIAEDLRAGKVQAIIRRLERLHPTNPETQKGLKKLIGYYLENASRMQYDEYLRLGYGIGSGAVESAHKQVVHARMRQAGMRWSEPGARRLLALRLLLLNERWAMLDQLRMVSLAA
ncbi:MAG: ISKra4 family transposase [Acidobacteria bacterium]|nr:MAG: ISKra4 family transposase [Acidobacteriota bacterium]